MPLEIIYERLTQVLRRVFNDDSVVATPELTANQVIGWDSFGHLRFIFDVEKTFGVKFAASQITSLKNVGALAELIQQKTAA